MFRPWALFVDDTDEKFMLHADGGEGNFRFEEVNKNPRDSKSHPELLLVARILKDDIEDLRQLARELPLNCFHGWNCQSFVTDLIEKARAEKVIILSQAKMDQIKGMVEGFDD